MSWSWLGHHQVTNEGSSRFGAEEFERQRVLSRVRVGEESAQLDGLYLRALERRVEASRGYDLGGHSEY